MINQTIEKLLTQEFEPLMFAIQDDSHKHAGHREVKASRSETHFSVLIVSKRFAGLSKVHRHQLVYKVLASLMNTSVHALCLQTYSPDEYQAKSIQSF